MDSLHHVSPLLFGLFPNFQRQEARDQAPTSTVGTPPDLEGRSATADDGDDSSMATAAPVVTTASMAEQEAKARDGDVVDDSGREGMGEGEGEGEVVVAPEGQSCEKGAGLEVEGGGDGDEGAPGLVVREGEGEGKGQEEANGVVGGAGDEEEEEEEEFNPYCFIAHLPPYNTVKHHTPEVGFVGMFLGCGGRGGWRGSGVVFKCTRTACIASG